MASASSDILMMAIDSSGNAIAAESQTTFEDTTDVDSLRTGFTAGQFWDVTDFGFNLGTMKAEQIRLQPDDIAAFIKKGMIPPAPPLPNSPEAVKIVDVQPISFTRQFDCGTAALFSAFSTATPLNSMTLIKRRAAGTQNSGLVYLRIDFTGVLLINLDWTDEERRVKETWKFICRQIKMQYRQQYAEGALAPVPLPGNWTMAS